MSGAARVVCGVVVTSVTTIPIDRSAVARERRHWWGRFGLRKGAPSDLAGSGPSLPALCMKPKVMSLEEDNRA